MEKIKVAILGAPSTGKTRIALEVVSELKKKSIISSFIGEYARNWMAKHKRFPEVPTDQFAIALRQIKRENEFIATQDVLVTDSASWLGIVYASLVVRHKTSYELSDLYHVMDLIEDTLPSDYTLHYYVPRGVFTPQLEGGRTQTTEEEFDLVDRKILGLIDLFNIPVKRLDKDHENWTGIIVNDIIDEIKKRKNERSKT
jgi:AAA+ ATPase superfamily predicted ATPase